MLIMFFIYKEQAFTLPVWGFSTLSVSTDWEVKGSGGGSGAGEGAVSTAAGTGGSGDAPALPPERTGNDERYCLSIYETVSLPVLKSPLINPF